MRIFTVSIFGPSEEDSKKRNRLKKRRTIMYSLEIILIFYILLSFWTQFITINLSQFFNSLTLINHEIFLLIFEDAFQFFFWEVFAFTFSIKIIVLLESILFKKLKLHQDTFSSNRRKLSADWLLCLLFNRLTMCFLAIILLHPMGRWTQLLSVSSLGSPRTVCTPLPAQLSITTVPRTRLLSFSKETASCKWY